MALPTGLRKKALLRLALFFLLLAPALLSAQPVFSWDKTLGGAQYEELQALQVLPDGYLIGGSSNSNAELGHPLDFSWNFLLYKLDPNRNTVWSRMYGGDADERLWMLIPVPGGGFLCGGYSFSGINGDKSEASRGGMDVWVLRLDDAGNKIWDKTFGGPDRDELFSALALPDGGFLLGCHSYSGTGGDKTEPARGGQDFWLLRIDAAGNLLWDKTLGGDAEEQLQDLSWASDGAVLLSGGTLSTPSSGEISADFARGGKDFWIGKFDLSSRQLLWNHRFGGTAEDFAYAIRPARTGKIYLGGRSASQPAPPTAYNNGKNSPFWGGYSDYWLLELDSDGRKLREWSFGGDGLDDLYALWENKRGDLVIAGVSNSDSTGNRTVRSNGGHDYWLLNLRVEEGSVRWQYAVGGPDNDALTKIAGFPNGALLFGGHSASNAGFQKTEDAIGGNDFWVIATECDPLVDIVQANDPPPCAGESLFLEAQASYCDSCLYFWSNGDTIPLIEVPPGTADSFAVMVIDLLGCMAGDTVYVQVDSAPPRMDLGPADTLLAAGTVLTLGGNNPAWQYQWNTGATGPSIDVSVAGYYAVTVTDPLSGCSAEDGIAIQWMEDGFVWVPNVFSPDFNGYNDYFTIFADESVRRVVTFQVYDRWGEFCFRRDNFEPRFDDDGWDGRFRGKPADTGVYGWFALIEFTDGSRKMLQGDVTLVR